MTKTETALDLASPSLYINRELSLLQFNQRVLELATDDAIPLLERLRFLCISCSNLDEFFEIRVSRLHQQQKFNIDPMDPAGMSAYEQIHAITANAHRLVRNQYDLLNEVLLPSLETEGVYFLPRSRWTESQAQWVYEHFKRELLPLITPLGLDPAHPFPRILNKSLNFIVQLEGKDAFGRDSGLALVQAPRALPRIIRMPEEIGGGPNTFVFLSSIIHAHVSDMFPGMTAKGCYQFRVTRNSDLFVEEDADDLLNALKGELLSRNYGAAIRLEVADNCEPHLVRFLMDKFQLQQSDVYQVNGPVNLSRLASVIELVDRPDLKYRPFTQGLPKDYSSERDMFDYITTHRNVLLHHPYQSFEPVIHFISQAAKDPDVVAIKMTLYRTGSSSAIADALVAAARAGKEVTAVIELRARFDEEANIALASRLQDAGAYVAYGVVGYKTHAKLTLVVRRHGKRLKRFVHLGTGNYHAGTAKAYTDFGLITDDPALGSDVHRLFMELTSLGKTLNLKKLLHAPFTLHSSMLEKIRRETAHAKAGKTARIRAQMNALIEPEIIRALYEASQAGVKIDLIVRGICSLRPGIKDISENIQVRSVMGRFLEHSRVFYFLNDGEDELYCASADWMPRNFFRRVESCFPIDDPKLKKRIIQETFTLYLRDNTQSWLLKSNGQYQRKKPSRDTQTFNAQESLLSLLAKQ
jgi:polyphosphate kinase